MPVGSSRVSKAKKIRNDRDVSHDEIQALLTKLTQIVPIMPRNRRLSRLEIIQHVIDYINDLEIALESRPEIIARKNNPLPRQPLSVLASPENACDPQEMDKISPARLPLSQGAARPALCEREVNLCDNLKSCLKP